MPKKDFLAVPRILTVDIQYRIYKAAGLIIPIETIEKIRRGERSQNTTTGQLVLTAEEDIKQFYDSNVWLSQLTTP